MRLGWPSGRLWALGQAGSRSKRELQIGADGIIPGGGVSCTGAAEPSGIALDSETLTEEKGNYKRLGFLDILLYRWELLDLSAVSAEERASLVAQAHNPKTFGIAQDGQRLYQLFGDRLNASSFVWMSANKEKQETKTPTAKTIGFVSLEACRNYDYSRGGLDFLLGLYP